MRAVEDEEVRSGVWFFIFLADVGSWPLGSWLCFSPRVIGSQLADIILANLVGLGRGEMGLSRNACHMYKRFYTFPSVCFPGKVVHSFHNILKGGLWSTVKLGLIRVASLVGFLSFLVEIKLAVWYSGKSLGSHPIVTAQSLGLLSPMLSQSRSNKRPDC